MRMEAERGCYVYQPRNIKDRQQSSRTGRGPDRFPLADPVGTSPADTPLADSWPPGLWESTFLLFKAQHVVHCCSSPGTLTHQVVPVCWPVEHRRQLRDLLGNDGGLEHSGERAKFSRTLVSFPGSPF